jgi:hypothetical protein
LQLRLILATALVGIAAGDPVYADPAAPIALFVNVAADSVANGAGADGPRQFVFHGVPLTVSAAHQAVDAGPGVTAGINGRHTIIIDDRLSMEASVTFSKTHSAQDALLDVGQGLDALASTSFRYHAGNLDLNVAPRIDATAAALGGRLPAYGFDSDVTQKLAADWNLSLATNYTQQGRDSIASGQVGSEGLALSYQFATAAELRIGYDYCWSLQDSDAGSVSQGPSIGTNFSPMEALNLALKYSYGATHTGAPASIGTNWLDDGSHHFDFNADWDLAPEGIAGAKIGASYGIQSAAAAADIPTQQSASINLALDF